MELKKINPGLKHALAESGLTEANELQQLVFSTVKSGADCCIVGPMGSGKTTLLAMGVLQRLEKPVGESTRALVIVNTKDEVLEMVELLRKFGQYTNLRILGTHEKGDIDYDKNQISLGLDILVGTPARINAVFASAGFNINTVKVFAVDDADELFKNRHDTAIARLSASIKKTQYIYTMEQETEKIWSMVENFMTEPYWFSAEDEEESE